MDLKDLKAQASNDCFNCPFYIGEENMGNLALKNDGLSIQRKYSLSFIPEN